MNHRTPRRSLVRVLAVVAVVVGTVGLVLPAGAHHGSVAFSGLATAEGSRVTYSIPNFLIVETPADGGGPIAQAALESSGLARGFASLPYPGDLAVTAPGTAASFGLEPAGQISYPFHVSADYPGVPEAEFADPSGSYRIAAEASPEATVAEARSALGADEGGAAISAAESSVVHGSDGGVVAEARSVSEGISLGEGVLRIGSVRSRSKTTLPAAGGDPETETETVIEHASVSGMSVSFGPDGLVLGEQAVPVPRQEMTDQLNEALADAGLSVRLLDAQDIEGGRMAPVLEVQSRQPLPIPGNPEGILVLRFGGATSAVLTGGSAGSLLPGPTGGSQGFPSATGGATGGGTATPPPARVSSSSSAGTVTSGGADTGTLAAEPAAFEPEAPAAAPAPVRLARDLRDDMRFVYLILAVGGALLLASSALWRTKGVQATWTTF